jgi:hypothetical protein
MFDYTCITSIHDYLKRVFPGAFVRGFAGAIARYGDAHVFEIGEADETATLTVAHRFLAEHTRDLESYLDEHQVPERLHRDGWVVVRADGVIEAFDRRRVRSYAGPMKLGQVRARRAT